MIFMKRLPQNLNGMEVRKLGENELKELTPELAGIVNESMYEGKGDERHFRETYFSGKGSYIAFFDGAEVAGYAKMMNLPATNTAYFSMLARRGKYRGTGLFSDAIFLSLGQGFEWESDQVACVTANNRVLGMFDRRSFICESIDQADIELVKKIAVERFGPKAEILDGFILNGTVLESYPNVPMHEYSSSGRINGLFEQPFERKRCDRRLLFRRLDKEAEEDYEEWLGRVEK